MAVDINGDGLIALGGTSTTQGRVRLAEDTDNGTNYVELTANAAVTTNRTVTFPDADIDFTTGLSATLGGTGITSAGTTGNVLTSNGTAWVSQAAAAGGGDYIMQVYAGPTSTTWTKPAGLKAVKVTVVGGGGNGGPSAPNPVYVYYGGSGGGGGVAIEYLDAPAIPGPVSVTAGGAAGTSSFGPFLSATGGGSGTSSPPSTPGNSGSGGSGSGGQINFSGTAGRTGAFGGGQCAFMGGAATIGTNTDSPSVKNGNIYGGGATGGYSVSGGATLPGGTGAVGIVIVEEFY
jgi:hypothetical protein